MEEKELREEDVIDLAELLIQVKKHIKMIVLVTLLCALIGGAYTVFLVKKQYSSTARIYSKPEVTEGTVNYSDINANNLMVNNYIEMIKGNNVQGQIAKTLDIERAQVKRSLSVTNDADTQIISITATTDDPDLAKSIAETSVEIFRNEVKESLNVTNIIIIDEAEVNSTPVSPSIKKNLLISAMVGLVISLAYVFIRFMLDTKIHNKDEAEKYLGIPMLGAVPYLEE